MANSLSTKLQLGLNPVLTTLLAPNGLSINIGNGFSWPNGILANTADTLYATVGSIANSSSPNSYNLTDGSLKALDGTTACVFAKVCGIAFVHLGVVGADDANIISIGAGTNAFNTWISGSSASKPVYAGGQFLDFNPTVGAYTVTPSTANILQIATAAGTNVPYILCLIGRSA